jgi:hypothetical protein
VRPQYQDDIALMILFDFITRQDDRHLSNIAIKIGGALEWILKTIGMIKALT